MNLRFWKKIEVPSGETRELEGLETWVVRWITRHGPYNCDTSIGAQAFTNKQDAELFAKALNDAFKLVKNTADNRIAVARTE